MKTFIYRLYVVLIAMPLFILITIGVSFSIVLAGVLGEITYVPYYSAKFWSKSACHLFRAEIKVEGMENIDKKQSYVFLANHQGYYDIFLVYGYLDHNFKWMMKEYLKKMPFIGLACMWSKQIFVGDKMSSISKAVTQAEKTLRGGMSMVIFPEGTRTHTGHMGEFRRGAFMLANQISLPIVPMTINGSFDVFSRHDFWMKPGKLTLTIHKPITAEERSCKDTKTVMKDVFDIIHDGLDEKYK